MENRNIYCGITRIRCSNNCDSCLVRYVCYTSPELTPIVVSIDTWRKIQMSEWWYSHYGNKTNTPEIC
jgi:hypothetical protein